MGTLDPMASGVLVLGFGKAARLFDLMQSKTKSYRATVEFGYTTDTLDAEGAITDRCDVLPTESALVACLDDFVGKISQIPPKYSALNIDGKRAYDLARSGKDFDLPTRTVEIFSIDPVAISCRDGYAAEMTFDVVCGSGTYIRSLCRDIAAECGTLGCMTSLVRTRSGNFSLGDCVSLGDFLSNPTAHLISADSVVEAMLPRVDVDEKSAFALLNGVAVSLDTDADLVAVFGDRLLGTARRKDGVFKMETRLCD